MAWYPIPLFLALVMSTLPRQTETAVKPFHADLMRSMAAMDTEMAAACMSGDVDHDFAAMMVPHHSGAIAMARAELAYGTDPVMRRLAEEIIVDQLSEVDAMHLQMKKEERTRGQKRCVSK